MIRKGVDLAVGSRFIGYAFNPVRRGRKGIDTVFPVPTSSTISQPQDRTYVPLRMRRSI